MPRLKGDIVKIEEPKTAIQEPPKGMTIFVRSGGQTLIPDESEEKRQQETGEERISNTQQETGEIRFSMVRS